MLVRGRSAWPGDLVTTIARTGSAAVWIDDVRLVPFFVLAGGVAAVVAELPDLEVLGALALRRCREVSPSTAVVVLALGAATPTLGRALDSGATAFLPWPSPPEIVAAALRAPVS